MSIDNSLWGEIPEAVEVKTPLSILKEQAALLAEATNRILEGQVRIVSDQIEQMVAIMRVVAPLLNNYSVDVCRIEYGLTMYPLIIRPINMSRIPAVQIKDEAEYVEYLKKILQSEDMKQILKALLVQSKAAK